MHIYIPEWKPLQAQDSVKLQQITAGPVFKTQYNLSRKKNPRKSMMLLGVVLWFNRGSKEFPGEKPCSRPAETKGFQ